MKDIREILFEGLFDTDLADQDTDIEYLYGLVTVARVASDYYIDYLDVRKIKQEFNSLSRKWEMKAWNENKYLTMDKFQKIDTDEYLRELLYIIVTKVKSIATKNKQRLIDSIKDVLKDYIKGDVKELIKIEIDDAPTQVSPLEVYIFFCNEFEISHGRRRSDGKIVFYLGETL